MSGNKALLKAAKAAFDAGDYDEAISKTEEVLADDNKNYNAKLLLGRALEKKRLWDKAEATYRSASTLKPDDFQAWSGLCSVYSSQGNKQIEALIDATTHLAQIHAQAENKEKCQDAIEKVVDYVRKQGNPRQVRQALSLTLPESSFYELLEGRVPHPAHTYTRIVESAETEEKDQIAQQISQRRTRLGAKLSEVTLEVKREIYGRSELDNLYRKLIDWLTDDDVRHEYEEKLLQHKYDYLLVVPAEQKSAKLNEVLDLAEGMVIIHHPYLLAWNLVLESRDVDNLQDFDANVLREYIQLFPESGLAHVLNAWLQSDLSPFRAVEPEEADNKEEKLPLTSEDRLLMFTEGLAKSEESPLAARLACEYFLSLDEFETTIQTARNTVKMLGVESKKLGLSLQNTKDAIKSALGTSLVFFQAPRNHVEAKVLLEDVLERKPKFTPALLGLGLIFEEIQEYEKAINFLQKALDQDPDNMRIEVELAWCRALNGEYASAQSQLEASLQRITATDPKSRTLRAQCYYRIGVCIWEQDASKTARKDRNGAYTRFLAAIKSDVEHAAAYTSLGYYYQRYARDKKRARQCFQKAFELSPAETEAAEQLARSFADQGDWEIVEVIAQRVIDTGRARPPPGSKRKGLSWPYSALGVAQMNKLEYQQAIVSFLAALRISPDEYQAYVGLGESYHNSGRYNSSARTFHHALDSIEQLHVIALDETWFARYMLANVHRELGEYDEAIDGLLAVLKQRSNEFGVLLSLLQTYVEKAWRCVSLAHFGQAVEAAKKAIDTASIIAQDRPQAFNLWKGLGDACMIFCSVQNRLTDFPIDKVTELLHVNSTNSAYDVLADVDRINIDKLNDCSSREESRSQIAVVTGILAFKKAILSCSSDRHAQAVAWYNLGWAEKRAQSCVDKKAGRIFLKAAVRCFKKAIELEAGNAEFWNALGVVTSPLNPAVAQHSFVRSLHINELNAKVWTNLGVLYYLQNDFELAQQAFGRAQSTDPEYAHAWMGAGLIALMSGHQAEALNHFTHAFEISDSWSVITKMQYTMLSFDMLLTTPSVSTDLTALIQPLFALEQLRMQVPHELPFRHLAALFLERVGSFAESIEALEELCTIAEADYESSEALAALARFAHAKADLARCQLANGLMDQAVENAEVALDLSSDAENSGLDAEARRALRLSCHLTAGLAQNTLKRSNEAISMFRAALTESLGNPDVVNLLVQVLWTHGGVAERAAARDSLFECVEKHPEHVGSVTLLGAIAALDDDKDTMAAVRDDLITLRTSDTLNVGAGDKIQLLLSAFAVIDGSHDINDAAVNEAQAAVLLEPTSSLAWTELAERSGELYPAQMAAVAAQKDVPPAGFTEATGLAQAYANCGNAGDGQRAIVLAPWEADTWTALGECFSGTA